MKIAYISDLHSDLCDLNYKFLEHVAQRLRVLSPDAFIIAGDVAETVRGVEEALGIFSNVDVPKFYLAGNHDLFAEGCPGQADFIDSQKKFLELLPEAVRRTGFLPLGIESASIGNLRLLGVPGWFDYSLRRPALECVVHAAQYEAGCWLHLRAYDHGQVYWPGGRRANSAGMPARTSGAWLSDLEIHNAMLASLAPQLKSVRPDEKVLAVVHVLPFKESVVQGSFGPSFYEAYLGSSELGNRLASCEQLVGVIHGHQHRQIKYTLDHFRVMASPVGDVRNFMVGLEDLAVQRLAVFEF